MKSLNILACFLFLGVAQAADYLDQSICRLQMDTGGRVILSTCTPWISKEGCNNGWVQWYENEGQGGGKGMHAIALAALMGNKKVMLRTVNNCSGQFDHLGAIRISK